MKRSPDDDCVVRRPIHGPIRRVAAAVALAMAACTTYGGVTDIEPLPGSIAAPVATRTFLDVHRCGPGKVKAAGVAEAHTHDLEVQGNYGVDYERYWVDETSGTIYCLVHAPSATAASTVHREAHGLVADEVHEVTCSAQRYRPTPGAPLFVLALDVGAGRRAAAAAVADLERHMTASTSGPRCLEYWYDATTGTVFGLLEGADADTAAAFGRGVAGVESCGVVPVVSGG